MFLYDIGAFIGARYENHWEPIQKGIVITSASAHALVPKILAQEDTIVVYTHFLGSDSIESHFGCLRRHTGPRASANVVMLSMRAMMLSSLNKHGLPLDSIRSSPKIREQFSPAFKAMAIEHLDLSSCGRSKLLTFSEKQALYYMSGSIVRKLLEENPLCAKCKLILITKPNEQNLSRWESSDIPDELPPPEFFTFQRNFGGLIYISYPAFNFICGVTLLFRQLYKKHLCSADVVEVLREQIIQHLDILPWLPECICNLSELLIDYSVWPLLNGQLNQSNRFDAQNASEAMHCFHRIEE